MRRRICIIAPTPAPYRAYEYDLLEVALREEYEFHVLFMERHWCDMQWQDDAPQLMSWEVLPEAQLPAVIHRVPGLRRVNRGTRRRLEVLQPDAILAQGYDSPTLWSAFRWAWQHGRPVLFRSDANSIDEAHRSQRISCFRIKRFLLRLLFDHIAAFLTIGSANEDYYRMYGALESRFFRASFIVDVAHFAGASHHQHKSGKPLKRQLGITADKVLLAVGRFIWQKDLATVVTAFRNALPALGDCVLVLAGDGPQRSAIESLAKPLGDRVRFVGFVQPDYLGDLYGIADVFILASIKEPWGLVISEAMAAELAIIASDRVGAAKDLVLPGRTGQLFVAGNPHSLAQTLVEVVGDASVAHALGRAGYAHLMEWNRRYDVVDGYRKALNYALKATRNTSSCA